LSISLTISLGARNCLARVCPNDRRVPEPWLRETVVELIRRRLFSAEE
jgi:hypothetical protein